jgi:hypothetical protein
MESWKKFIDELKLTEKLEEIYFRIRLVLQKEGWSDKDLEKPPYYPQDLMSLFHKFQNERDKVIKTIEDYGFEIDINDLTNYIQIKLKSIDNITPLKN